MCCLVSETWNLALLSTLTDAFPVLSRCLCIQRMMFRCVLTYLLT